MLAHPRAPRWASAPDGCRPVALAILPRVRRRHAAWQVLLALWEAPQNALGVVQLALHVALRHVRRARVERARLMIELSRGSAVSLGAFVFFTERDNPFVPVGPENRDHEYGHSIQSRWLGPLYLPVVGVPSLARVAYAIAHRTLTGRRWGGYYAGYPERWADRLGGADVSRRPPP